MRIFKNLLSVFKKDKTINNETMKEYSRIPDEIRLNKKVLEHVSDIDPDLVSKYCLKHSITFRAVFIKRKNTREKCVFVDVKHIDKIKKKLSDVE